MGLSESKNIVNTSANVISSVTNTYCQTAVGQTNQEQSIIVKEVTGDVDIDGNQFSSTATLDVSALLKALSDSSAKQDISLQMAQSAKSIIKDINLGNLSTAANVVESIISETINITTNVESNCSARLGTKQTIDIENVDGNVRITGNTFQSVLTSIQSCSVDALSKNSAINSLQQKVDQISSSSVTGISIWGLAAVGLIIVAAIGMVLVGPEVVPLIAVSRKPQLFGGLVMVIGLAFLLIWWFWTGKGVKSTNWAKPLESCSSMAQNVAETGTFQNADAAAEHCLKVKDCVAFDYNGKEETAKYFVKLSKGCKIEIDDTPILVIRTPPFVGTDLPTNANEGDVYINPVKATIQKFENSNWSIAVLIKEGITSLNTVDGEKFVEGSNFSLDYDDNMYNFRITNLLDGQVISVAGPGLKVDKNSKPNVSGLVYKTRKQWALYTGGGLLIAGLLLVIFLKPKVTTPKKSSVLPSKQKGEEENSKTLSLQ